MKRSVGYLTLGLACYAVFLLALFPASYAYTFVAKPMQQSLPQLEVNGVSGRVWNGKAGAVAFNGREIGELNWQLSPLSLLVGSLNMPLSLQLPNGYLEAEANLPFDASALEAEQVKGQVPVSQLQNLFPYYPVSVDGTLSFDVDHIEVDSSGWFKAIDGKVNWLGAAVVAPQQMAFGDLQAELQLNEQGELVAQLKDLGGPLKLDARLTLQKDLRYSIEGTVAAANGAEAGLRQALGWLGKKDGQGRHRLNFSGVVRQ